MAENICYSLILLILHFIQGLARPVFPRLYIQSELLPAVLFALKLQKLGPNPVMQYMRQT